MKEVKYIFDTFLLASLCLFDFEPENLALFPLTNDITFIILFNRKIFS